MPQNNYDVDDILEEIRRKKARQDSYDHSDTYAPRSRPREPEPEHDDKPPHPPRRTVRSQEQPSYRRAREQQPEEKPLRREQPEQTSGRTARPKQPPEQESRPVERRRSSRQNDGIQLDWGTRETPKLRANSSGFAFRAPGVADEQERRQRGAGALNPDTDDFSLHFNLDETEEASAPKRAKRLRSFADTQEINAAARRRKKDTASKENRLAHSQWRQSYSEQEMLEQEAPEDDYSDPGDAQYVRKDLKKIRMGLGVRIGLTSLLAIVLLYLSMAVTTFPYAKLFGLEESYMLPLPSFMFPEQSMRIFLLVSLILSVITAVIGSNVISAGLSSLFRLRSDSDTPAALAMLAVLVQGIVLVIFPDAMSVQSAADLPAVINEKISLYFPAAAIILLFTLIGKLMLTNRIWRNFQFLSADEEKTAFLQIQNRDFAREFSRGLGPDIDRVAYSAPTGFMTGFLDKSYSGDYSDTFSCVAAPVSLAGGILVAAVTAFLSKDAVISVCAFTAVMCICAPLSAAIVPNLMLGRMSKWLTKRNAMVAGYESAEDCADTNAILLSDKDLFSEECVHLHGMKVFAEKRIDEAILDAASVILACDGIMSGVFLNMIGGNRSLLRRVDGLIYEDGMGLSAWVDGKRVLIGNAELMRGHEIDCPSRDYEARYLREGRKILYISNSGELSAMFVISYNGEPRVADRLAELQRRGISLALFATDPNVMPELVSSAFNVKKGSVRVLPAKLHPEYNYLTRQKERVSAGVAHAGGLPGILQVIRASSSVCRSVHHGAIAQLIGVIVGYGLVAFMAFTNSLELITQITLLLFGLGWLVITSLFSSFVKS